MQAAKVQAAVMVYQQNRKTQPAGNRCRIPIVIAGASCIKGGSPNQNIMVGNGRSTRLSYSGAVVYKRA